MQAPLPDDKQERSPHEVIAHLINGERTDWIPRARLILAGDPTARFVPFDREGFFVEVRVVHDLGHVVQISRTMARQLTTEVGPWTAYLGVLGTT